MSDSYQEIREELRRKHSMNANEVSSKGRYTTHTYGGYRDTPMDDMKQEAVILSLRTKVFLFLASVMLFSCYLYGEQDVKKGAERAWNEFGQQITVIGEEQPYVKKAVDSCKNGYRELVKLWNAMLEETK